ncbi:MAG: hypothetical protein ABWZ25_08575 [Chitinophagaceae bacterium]
MKRGYNKIKYVMFIGASGLLFLFNACKKEFTSAIPGDKESISLNFYAASDVLKTIGKGVVPVFIDKYEPNRVINSFNSPYPFFDYDVQGQKLDYPYIFGTHSGLYYARFDAGSHHYMFTDTTRCIVVDTTLMLPAKTYTCFYLTDAAVADNSPAKYIVKAVNELRSVPDGKVGVRFVHMSADAGDLTCSFQKADGSLVNSLPETLKFGEASAYQYYDANDVSANKLLLFSLNNTNTGATILTGVSFNPGRSYIIVISGFLRDQMRQIPTVKNPDGSFSYVSATIGKNLRAEIRTSY